MSRLNSQIILIASSRRTLLGNGTYTRPQVTACNESTVEDRNGETENPEPLNVRDAVQSKIGVGTRRTGKGPGRPGDSGVSSPFRVCEVGGMGVLEAAVLEVPGDRGVSSPFRVCEVGDMGVPEAAELEVSSSSSAV